MYQRSRSRKCAEAALQSLHLRQSNGRLEIREFEVEPNYRVQVIATGPATFSSLIFKFFRPAIYFGTVGCDPYRLGQSRQFCWPKRRNSQ